MKLELSGVQMENVVLPYLNQSQNCPAPWVTSTLRAYSCGHSACVQSYENLGKLLTSRVESNYWTSRQIVRVRLAFEPAEVVSYTWDNSFHSVPSRWNCVEVDTPRENWRENGNRIKVGKSGNLQLWKKREMSRVPLHTMDPHWTCVAGARCWTIAGWRNLAVRHKLFFMYQLI